MEINHLDEIETLFIKYGQKFDKKIIFKTKNIYDAILIDSIAIKYNFNISCTEEGKTFIFEILFRENNSTS